MDSSEVAEPLTDAPVSGRTASGILWLTLQKWVIRIFGFVTIIVLTRILSPEEFGTVAAAGTVLPFFYLLADLGFAAYIVQVEKTNPRMLSTAFWFSMGAGTVLCVVLIAISPLLGFAFADERVVPVLQVLSVWVIVTAVGSVPSAILRREMRFATLALQGAIAALIAQVVAVVMALTGFGVWALVAQSLVAPVVMTVLVWIAARWTPRFTFSRPDFKLMAGFGSQVLGVELVAMLRAWGEAAIISRVLGITTLGHMSIAQRLVQIVQELTGSAIVPVTNVAFAKIRNAVDRLRAAYLKALKLTYAALSLPMIVVAVAAPVLIPLLFGDNWQASVAPAQVLAIAGMLAVGAWLDHGLFYGVGRPGTWFVYALIIDVLTVLTTLLTAHWGLTAIAWGFLGVAALATIVRWFLVARVLQTRLRVVMRPFLYLVLVVTTAGLAGWGVAQLVVDLPDILALILIGIAVLSVHVGVTALIARDVVREAWRLLMGTSIGNRLRTIVERGRS